MPIIKPISDLRNYNSVLDSVKEGSPVFLTKNGRGCYAIMDIADQEDLYQKALSYAKMEAQLQLMCELNAGRKSGEENGWISAEDVKAHFDNKWNEK